MTMGDDDETPPGRPRPRRAQTATERDIDGMRARAARQAAAEASLESERARRMSRSSGSGIPIPQELDAGEPTEPWDTLDRELLKPDEAKIVELSKRSGHDLITVADWAKTMALVTRNALDDRSAQRERAAQEKALLEVPHRVEALEKTWSTWSKVGLLIAGGLVAGATWLADRISANAERVGQQTEQLRTLERENRDLHQEIRDLRRGKDTSP